MLVLSRRHGESIVIGMDAKVLITVIDINIKEEFIKLGFKAPFDLKVYRKEVYDNICRSGLKN